MDKNKGHKQEWLDLTLWQSSRTSLVSEEYDNKGNCLKHCVKVVWPVQRANTEAGSNKTICSFNVEDPWIEWKNTKYSERILNCVNILFINKQNEGLKYFVW